MRFSKDVVVFDLSGVPLVGCLETGAVIGLTPEGAKVCERLVCNEVSEEELARIDFDLMKCLQRGGFLGNASGDSRVNSAYLHVTNRCNLDCAGCYSYEEGRDSCTDPLLSDLIHAIHELRSVGLRHLIISGGEPFLRKDLPDIVRAAKESGGIEKVTILSNGTRISKEMLSSLCSYVDCISVSFDGYSSSSPAYIRAKQRFNALVEAICLIRSEGIQAHIIPTIHAKNISDLSDYVSLAEELGVSMNFSLFTCPASETLAHLVPSGEDLRLLGNQLLALGEGKSATALLDTPVGSNLSVKRYCGAASSSLSIAADGTIYPCHMLHCDEFALGNAFYGTIDEALKGPLARSFRTLDASKFDGCDNCEFVYLCGGGCRARSKHCSSNIFSQDAYCELMRTFFVGIGEKLRAQYLESSS